MGMAWNDESERAGMSGWQLLCKEVRTKAVLWAECLTRRYGAVTSAQLLKVTSKVNTSLPWNDFFFLLAQ